MQSSNSIYTIFCISKLQIHQIFVGSKKKLIIWIRTVYEGYKQCSEWDKELKLPITAMTHGNVHVYQLPDIAWAWTMSMDKSCDQSEARGFQILQSGGLICKHANVNTEWYFASKYLYFNFSLIISMYEDQGQMKSLFWEQDT